MQESIIFGEQPTVDYVHRPGAYGLFFNDQRELGLVRTDGGRYFLAGGGIEEGEDREEALIREVQEETGLQAKVQQPIGIAAEYYLDGIENVYYKKTGYFYLIDILGQAPEGKTEDDHTLLWLPPESASPLLFHDMYRWALQQALKAYE